LLTRHDPGLAPAIRGRRDRWIGEVWPRGRLDGEQQEKPKAWVGATLPRTTRQAGAFSAKEFCGVYESHSGLIALLHRLGFEYHKAEIIPRRLDEAKPKAFIAACEKLLNSLAADAAMVVADAAHPIRARRLLGVAPREVCDPADERAPAHRHSRRG
jgi:hypothetical protein